MIMKTIVYNILYLFFRLLPLQRNTVFISSFTDLYNDNPRYISEELHRERPDLKQVWPFSNRTNREDVPSYVVSVEAKSIKELYYICTSKLLIDNYIGARFKLCRGKITDRIFFSQRKNQINISTWHGTPLKYVGKDVDGRSEDLLISTSTGFIANSEYEETIFRRAFDSDKPIYLLGSARNDLLFHLDEKNRILLRNKMGIPSDCKVILYAPTFRDGINGKPADTIMMSINEAELCINAAKKRFGGEWVFIYRAHQKVIDKAVNTNDTKKIINGNLHDDMAEYLAISDILITDYSGSLFDFTFTYKPCFLYVPDIETYSNGRGLYMDMKDLPYENATDMNSLINLINNYSAEDQKAKIDRFNDRIGAVDDGLASYRIVKLLIELIEK